MSGRWAVSATLVLAALLLPASAAPPPRPEGPAAAAGETGEDRFADLFATASLWQVGDNVERVEAARRQLSDLGEPVVRWLVEHRLGVATTLERRALDAVLVARKDLAAPLLRERLRAGVDATPATRVNLARLARKLGLREAAPTLAAWLDDLPSLPPTEARALAREVLAALSVLDPGRAVAAGRRLLEARDPWTRVAALRALGRSGDPGVADDLVAVAIGPATAIVRGAAALALVDLGEPAAAPLERALGHCSREDAAPSACGFAVRAAAALLPDLPGDTRASLRRALDRVAALGPAPLAALAVELAYGPELAPGR